MDIIGTICTPAFLDAEGGITTEPSALPGWHINTPTEIAGWEPYRVFPETPMRVYAGHETVCYAFQDEASFKTAAIKAELMQADTVEQESGNA